MLNAWDWWEHVKGCWKLLNAWNNWKTNHFLIIRLKAESLKLYWNFTGFYSKKAPWYSGGANASIFSKIGLKLQKTLLWPIWSLVSKTDEPSKISRWNQLKFLHTATNSRWLKVDRKFWEIGMVKNGCGHSGDGTLKLSVSAEWTDRTNWIFVCWYRFTEIKKRSKRFWWACSKMGVASLVTGL